MKKIDAEIIADSKNQKGDRIITYLLTYPRIIHSELMTHRVFSRNAASSRAIPFEKMVKMVEEDPFIPIAWQKDHKGMQGAEYFTERISVDTTDLFDLRTVWLDSRDAALNTAKRLNRMEVTKQLCNRLLEPFQWMTTLVTTTEYDNFFELRCPKYNRGHEHAPTFHSKLDMINYYKDFDESYTALLKNYSFYQFESINSSKAEIHIQALAEAMWDARNESTPKELKHGEWHIPFGDKMDETKLFLVSNKITKKERPDLYPHSTLNKELTSVRVATARCARLSYMTFDGEIDYEKDIQLHDHLLSSKHFSPFEHCARVMDDAEYVDFAKTVDDGKGNIVFNDGWCNNFKGFIQYRYLVDNNYD